MVPRTRSPMKKGRKIIKFHKEDKISFGGSISLHTRKPPRSSPSYNKLISETVPPPSCKKTSHPPSLTTSGDKTYNHHTQSTKTEKGKRKGPRNPEPTCCKPHFSDSPKDWFRSPTITK